MNMPEPIATILLPVFNCENYVEKAVRSILDQSSNRWRLLAINDGSTDSSGEILDKFASDGRVTIVHQSNTGLGETLNRGLALCNTKYIARMDADDVAHPQRIEKQLEFLEANSQVGLLGTQICRLGERKADKGSYLPTQHDDILRALMIGQHAICHPTIMCRKEAFDQVGNYIAGLGEEWDIYLRFSEHWKLANLDEPLLQYRFHSASINGKKMGELRRRIRHACESSRRRIDGKAPITYEQFVESEASRGWIAQVKQRAEDLSRAYYHSSVADILGTSPMRGYFRLAVAAGLSPHLTLRRLWQKLAG